MLQGDLEPPAARASGPAPEREAAATAARLREKLRDHTLPQAPGGPRRRVLEFGAGGGAVAIALHRATGLPSDACDVDAAAMAVLADALPPVRCAVHGAVPPLPFADGTFDAVYALSAWSHLPPSAGLVWLGELARVMKADALALIAVCGPGGVRRRRETGRPGWRAVADEDLARNGALFMPLGPGPGLADPFGMAAYSHAHLVYTWDPILAVEAIYAEAMADGRDLIVLRRTGPAAPGGGGGSMPWRRLARYGRRIFR